MSTLKFIKSFGNFVTACFGLCVIFKAGYEIGKVSTETETDKNESNFYKNVK